MVRLFAPTCSRHEIGGSDSQTKNPRSPPALLSSIYKSYAARRSLRMTCVTRRVVSSVAPTDAWATRLLLCKIPSKLSRSRSLCAAKNSCGVRLRMRAFILSKLRSSRSRQKLLISLEMLCRASAYALLDCTMASILRHDCSVAWCASSSAEPIERATWVDDRSAKCEVMSKPERHNCSTAPAVLSKKSAPAFAAWFGRLGWAA